MRLPVGLGRVGLALVAPAASYGQSAPEPRIASEEDATADILVTARKRSENVQDVPATIQAVGAEQLANAGVSTFRDLMRVAPGLNIASRLSNASV